MIVEDKNTNNCISTIVKHYIDHHGSDNADILSSEDGSPHGHHENH